MAQLPLLALYTTKTLDLSSTDNGLVIPLGGTGRILLAIGGLSGSGAELRVFWSRDNGATFSPDGSFLTAHKFDFPAQVGDITSNGEYALFVADFTHLKISPSKAGTGIAILAPTPLSSAGLSEFAARVGFGM